MPSMFPPKKNTSFTLYFPIRDADGDPVTGATLLDSEVSVDGIAFVDCTNEAVEIGVTGIYSLAMTAAEMNGDVIIVQTKTTSAGAKTAVNIVYTSARLFDDLAFPTISGRSVDVSVGGEVGIDWANVGSPATVVTLANTSVGLLASAITSAVVATGAIDANALAPDVVNDVFMGSVLTESYAVDGAAATPAQLLYMILQLVSEFAIAGTTITTKKLDGITTAMTHALDSATDPTSRTRAT